MGFGQAIQTCFRKYVTFRGRAPRSEFWYFTLFSFLLGIGAGILDEMFFRPTTASQNGPISSILTLAMFLPSLAVSVRRLHDTNRSGFWLLAFYGAIIVGVAVFAISMFESLRTGAISPAYSIGLLAIVLGAMIWLLVWFCQRGTTGPNRFGADPFGPDVEVFR